MQAPGSVPASLASAWGMTETAPCATAVHFAIGRAGVIGLPVPGCDILLAPVDGRHEIRVRGPNVTPGFFRRPDLTEEAFEGGWLRTGDAARLQDPDDPARGIVFDGRIAENFKLTSATWVNVGVLRPALLASVPLLADAVVAGHDRDEIAVLGLPNWPACRALCPDLPAEAPPGSVAAHPAVRAALAVQLARHNTSQPGSSTAVARVILMVEPPSIDADEITDKGYINQRAVLTRRAELVERLYATPTDPDVVAAHPRG